MDKNSKPIGEDLGDDAFSYQVKSPTSHVRVWVQLLNLHNGTYIGRFRPYRYGGPLTISIRSSDNKHVADSPYQLKEVYSDDCYCPQPMEQWTSAMQCPKSYPQIKVDLQPHKIIKLEGLRDRMLQRFNKRGSFCHYVIKNNEIYRECHGKTTDFKIFVDEVLLSISKKATLPDMELYWNLGDWPLEKNIKSPLPIISWCGSRATSDVILPTYDLTGSMLNMMGRVSLDVLSVQGNLAPSWDDKVPKGFFRGRDSRKERLNLAEMSVNQPHLINASITNYFFFKMDEEKYGKKVKPISFMKFFEHKYQLNVDGTVAAYRFPYLMVGDSVVMKQDSDFYEHFYRQLQPSKHYIPLKHSLSDVAQQVEWARANDKKVREIQKAGMERARELLTPVNIFCYHAILFRELARRQEGEVNVLEGMSKVEHQTNSPTCNCLRKHNNKKKDEL